MDFNLWMHCTRFNSEVFFFSFCPCTYFCQVSNCSHNRGDQKLKFEMLNCCKSKARQFDGLQSFNALPPDNSDRALIGEFWSIATALSVTEAVMEGGWKHQNLSNGCFRALETRYGGQPVEDTGEEAKKKGAGGWRGKAASSNIFCTKGKKQPKNSAQGNNQTKVSSWTRPRKSN